MGAARGKPQCSAISEYTYLPLHFKLGITDLLLAFNMAQLKMALCDGGSEAYSRIAIDYLIVACMVKHKKLLSKKSELPADQSELPANDPTAATSPILEQSELPTDNSHDQKATIVPVHHQATEVAGPSYIAPTTPLMAPETPFQPLPIKVFPEMALSVQVKRRGREWHISGIADWAMGYGDRRALEDGTVLLAVEAKRQKFLFDAEAQLLAYLATIRQLRIQANKKNVMTQGFYSDGEIFRFLCIRYNILYVPRTLSRCLIFCLACLLLRRRAHQTQVLLNQGRSRMKELKILIGRYLSKSSRILVMIYPYLQFITMIM